MDVNAESSLLQPANRDGGIDQDWAGDDQDWWDWYVTLAENDDAPIALVAGAGLPDVDPADDEQLRVELAAPYRLDAAQREAFRRDAFIKLAHVLSPAVVRRLAKRLDSLLRAEHGDDVAGRFIALGQLWLHDEVMRLVAFSPRLAGLAAELLGEPAIRIYHDNATAGPNRSTQPRRALSTTYYADGARVLESPTLVSGRWRDFLPGVEPGGLAVSTLNPIVAGREGERMVQSV